MGRGKKNGEVRYSDITTYLLRCQYMYKPWTLLPEEKKCGPTVGGRIYFCNVSIPVEKPRPTNKYIYSSST
jgi:hypothetical protein